MTLLLDEIKNHQAYVIHIIYSPKNMVTKSLIEI